jgi:hypothetical protein
MIGLLKSSWPSMPTHHEGPGLALTDRIEAQISLELPGSGIMTGTVYIEETYVRKDHFLNPLKWTVDACIAFSTDPKAALQIVAHLPAEPCTINLLDINWSEGLYMTAHAIDADVEITLPDGNKGKGILSFPDVKSWYRGGGLFVVDALETGKIVNGVRQPDVITFPD